jgi:SAM-dependent methyltransferase
MITHEEYFADQAQCSNPDFWRRFGRRPSFAGKRVLDFGCGHGAMTLEMARDGASVLGIDLDAERIGWAQEHVAGRPVSGDIQFRMADITTLGLRDECDIIVSKDSFEHITDLPRVLVALRDALTPSGAIWAGFSPLYHSPWGDHGRTGLKLPWAHTLPRPIVLAAATRLRGQPVDTLDDIGLNGLTPDEFRHQIAGAGLRFESLLYNRSDKRLMTVLTRLRRYRPLELYATVGIYAVLRRADPAERHLTISCS